MELLETAALVATWAASVYCGFRLGQVDWRQRPKERAKERPPDWAIVSVKPCAGKMRVVTFGDGRQYMGRWLVWSHPGGRRCSTELERAVGGRVAKYDRARKLERELEND